jgi:NAD+ kinase
MPGTAATAVTVICPHALSSRPLVVSDSTVVGITPLAAEVPLVLDIDGECAKTVAVGETVRIRKGARSVRIAFLPGDGGYRVLKRKLGWNDGGTSQR